MILNTNWKLHKVCCGSDPRIHPCLSDARLDVNNFPKDKLRILVFVTFKIFNTFFQINFLILILNFEHKILNYIISHFVRNFFANKIYYIIVQKPKKASAKTKRNQYKHIKSIRLIKIILILILLRILIKQNTISANFKKNKRKKYFTETRY